MKKQKKDENKENGNAIRARILFCFFTPHIYERDFFDFFIVFHAIETEITDANAYRMRGN